MSPACRVECLQQAAIGISPPLGPRGRPHTTQPWRSKRNAQRRPGRPLPQSPPERRWTQASRLASRPVLDPKVIKAYDVRGIYPAEIDEEGAYAIGRAFVEQFEPKRIAVGHDMRVSSPGLTEAVTDGAADAGADVLQLGLIGTETLYFAVGDLGLDGGVAVTASHNPKEYTGMKIVRRGALPVGGESGLLDIRDRAVESKGRSATGKRGRVEPYDIWPAHVDRVLSVVAVQALKPLRMAIDAANMIAGATLPRVLARLPIEAIRFFFEPDGSFPGHPPNALLP